MHEVTLREATLAHDRDLTAMQALRDELRMSKVKFAGLQQEVKALQDQRWVGLEREKARKIELDALRKDFQAQASERTR